MKKNILLFCVFALIHAGVYAQPPKGWQTECVGYHLVDIPGEMEAATEPVSSNAYSQIGGGEFSEHLRVMEDGFDSGELTVEVSHPSTREEFERYIPGKYTVDPNDGKKYLPSAIHYAKTEIERRKEMEADLEKEKSKYDPEDFRIGRQKNLAVIARYEAEVKAWEEIPEIWVDKDSYYYGGWLWLWRAPRIYRIRLNEEALPKGKSRQEATLSVVGRFQPRKAGEVPAGAGFCVPYGFVQGVSGLPYRSQTTMRMKGEPGLLYTVRFQSDALTGVVAHVGYAPETARHRTVSEAVRLGGHDGTLTGWRAAPFKETKLPNGRYRIEKKDKEGNPEVLTRSIPQGEVFALRAQASGVKGDPLTPAMLVMFNAFSFNADPQMGGRPVMPLEKALPGFRQFLASIRLREENAQALKAAKDRF